MCVHELNHILHFLITSTSCFLLALRFKVQILIFWPKARYLVGQKINGDFDGGNRVKIILVLGILLQKEESKVCCIVLCCMGEKVQIPYVCSQHHTSCRNGRAESHVLRNARGGSKEISCHLVKN